MTITYEQVRGMVLTLPGTREGNSYGGPSLHVGTKFLGRLRDDGETLVLKVDFDTREALLADQPDTYFLTDHYRSSPLVLVNLLTADARGLEPLIAAAWRSLAGKRIRAAYDAVRKSH